MQLVHGMCITCKEAQRANEQQANGLKKFVHVICRMDVTLSVVAYTFMLKP